MKFKITKRRKLIARKPWMLVYPDGKTLLFKTFEKCLIQFKLLLLIHQSNTE